MGKKTRKKEENYYKTQDYSRFWKTQGNLEKYKSLNDTIVGLVCVWEDLSKPNDKNEKNTF